MPDERKPGYLLVYSPLAAKDDIKAIPGRLWDAERRAWTVPEVFRGDVIAVLQRHCPAGVSVLDGGGDGDTAVTLKRIRSAIETEMLAAVDTFIESEMRDGVLRALTEDDVDIDVVANFTVAVMRRIEHDLRQLVMAALVDSL